MGTTADEQDIREYMLAKARNLECMNGKVEKLKKTGTLL